MASIAYIPFFRIRSDKYLIGTWEHQLECDGLDVYVKIDDDDIIHLKQYLQIYATEGCFTFHKFLKSKACSVKETVLDLLGKYNADKESI